MKLLFKQRVFSWFDSYDIYNEAGNPVFSVKGRLSWGHCLEVYDMNGNHMGTVKEEVLSFLPRFAVYINDQYVGQIKKEFSLFRPVFTLDCNGWQVDGDYFQWEYSVSDQNGFMVMQASKQWLNWGDTYTMDITHERDALLCLMIVLAIDAAKCSSGNR